MSRNKREHLYPPPSPREVYEELEKVRDQAAATPDENHDAWLPADVGNSLVSATARIALEQAPNSPTQWSTQVLPLIRWKSATRRSGRFRVSFEPLRGLATALGVPFPNVHYTGQPVSVWPAINNVVAPDLNDLTLLTGFPPNVILGAERARIRMRWGIGTAVMHELYADYPCIGSAVDVDCDQCQVDVYFDEGRPFSFIGGAPPVLPLFGATMGPCNKIESGAFGLSHSRILTLDSTVFPVLLIIPPWSRTCHIQFEPAAVPLLSWVDAQGNIFGRADGTATGAVAGSGWVQPIPVKAIGLRVDPPAPNVDVRMSVDWRISP